MWVINDEAHPIDDRIEWRVASTITTVNQVFRCLLTRDVAAAAAAPASPPSPILLLLPPPLLSPAPPVPSCHLIYRHMLFSVVHIPVGVSCADNRMDMIHLHFHSQSRCVHIIRSGRVVTTPARMALMIGAGSPGPFRPDLKIACIPAYTSARGN